MDLYSFDFYKKSADYVKERLPFTPEIAIILGSSLGSFADEIDCRDLFEGNNKREKILIFELSI